MDQVKRLGRRVSVALLLVLLATSIALPVAADPQSRIDDIADRRAKIAAKLERLGHSADRKLGRIEKLDAQQNELLAQVDRFDARIARLTARIDDVTDRLTNLQHSLALLSQELDDLVEQYTTRRELFVRRAVAAYKGGSLAYLDGLLSSETFSDLIDRYTYYEASMQADVTLLDELDALRTEVQLRSDLINERQIEVASLKGSLEDDRAVVAQVRAVRKGALDQLNSLLGRKRQELASINSKRRHYLAIQAQLERESDSIALLILAQNGGPLPVGGGQLLWPAAGPVTSGFGPRTHPIFGDTRMHTGIDIGAPYGAPVIAADAGRVIFTGALGGYGNTVIVDHAGPLATTYNHLSSYAVGEGQIVTRGQYVAAVGCTGYCTGPHLHFEVRVNGHPVDPIPYLQ